MYEIIVNYYKDNKIEYKKFKNELERFNKNIKIYKENRKYFDKKYSNSSEIINYNKKVAKVLKKIIDEIKNNKIKPKLSNIGPKAKKKVIDITWINDPVLFNKINKDVLG